MMLYLDHIITGLIGQTNYLYFYLSLSLSLCLSLCFSLSPLSLFLSLSLSSSFFWGRLSDDGMLQVNAAGSP